MYARAKKKNPTEKLLTGICNSTCKWGWMSTVSHRQTYSTVALICLCYVYKPECISFSHNNNNLQSRFFIVYIQFCCLLLSLCFLVRYCRQKSKSQKLTKAKKLHRHGLGSVVVSCTVFLRYCGFKLCFFRNVINFLQMHVHWYICRCVTGV